MEKSNLKLNIAILASIAIYIFGIFSYFFLDIGKLGTLGDFIGGNLNPIFSFLSFLILIKTINYQKESLDNSREELALTRKELERSADSQELTRKIQEEQSKTQILQQFENTFFSLIDQIKNNEPSKAFVTDSLRDFGFSKNISEARTHLSQHRETHSHYFRLIYQTLKFIDVKTVGKSEIDTIFYKNILRSTLTPNTTILLGVNSAILPKFSRTDSFLSFKKLIEKYSMLQHMPFSVRASETEYSSVLVQMIGCYEESAFSENIYFKRMITQNENIVERMKKLVADI